jgi:hypothetical protein
VPTSRRLRGQRSGTGPYNPEPQFRLFEATLAIGPKRGPAFRAGQPGAEEFFLTLPLCPPRRRRLCSVVHLFTQETPDA